LAFYDVGGDNRVSRTNYGLWDRKVVNRCYKPI